MNDENEPELQLLFSLKPGTDRRRFNFQRTNEVAAIFSTTADGEIPESYVTIRNKHTKLLQCVSTMDPNVAPWIYPLFYPYGSRGWHRNLERIKIHDNDITRRITRLAYTKYKIAIRPDEFNAIIMGRRLFQQWIVDSYVKVEKDRIQWCKDHQKEIKADTYQGLHDYLQNSTNDIDGQVGKTIILPSTFLGSPRHMQQSYQDAMALVARTGKPDIFLTMTCNPKWKEIQENLLPGQQACDIVARKRGLPHMHLLITLRSGYKITTPAMVNKFISAELPNKDTDPILYDIVVKNMIHGPCGDWCMVNNKCSKEFPKEFQNENIMDKTGYPHYQRSNNGITHELLNGHVVNNRWIVPYCRELLEMFDCHINVEIVSSVRVVKYLYKYIYKGHDAATVTIGNENVSTNIINHDEVSSFIETRYVGPVEACYRIFSKPLQDKSHAIERLPIHLPHQQYVVISSNAENIVDNLHHASTACLELGLIEDDEEWAKAMEEARIWMMPRRLRQLFVRILIHYQPIHPEELWDKFKDALSEDFSRTHDVIISHQMAYAEINNLLNYEGKSLADYPTMDQTVVSHLLLENNNESLQSNYKEIGERQYQLLNEQQKEIVDVVLNLANETNNHDNNCIYIDGPVGSGKTFIYTSIYNLLCSKKIKVSSMAFTGIAAILLPQGKTVHKTFGLPVPMYSDSSSSITAQSKDGLLLKETKVFIWDEAPMASRYA
ncbi:uncharacterized protein LOC131668782 [Phymastichus coffea]|uniref:uncharacterized protein LOC131668782 n=1 Tax=Phymastichus coffea TaxID=108790 RepID=UPI00273C78AC|nr:uncharacterized protein LOC131668782 [Phymastichus coffea]